MKTKKLSRLFRTICFGKSLDKTLLTFAILTREQCYAGAETESIRSLRSNLAARAVALLLINQSANILLVLLATLLAAAFVLELLRRQDRRALARPQFLFLDRYFVNLLCHCSYYTSSKRK